MLLQDSQSSWRQPHYWGFRTGLALDMLLAEKSGVPYVWQSVLHLYSKQRSPVCFSDWKLENGLIKCLEKGKWWILSVLIPLISAVSGFVLYGCHCIPCICLLCNRIIITAIEGKQPPPYQMPQFPRERAPLMEDLEEETVVNVL